MINQEKARPVMDYNNLEGDFGLWALFAQTRDTISKAREAELSTFNVSKIRSMVLFILANENRELSLHELSEWLFREPNSVLMLVTRMERDGLVKKIKDKNSRKTLVSLSDKGREIYTNEPRESIAMIFSVLSDEQKENLRFYLHELMAKSRDLLKLNYKPPFML